VPASAIWSAGTMAGLSIGAANCDVPSLTLATDAAVCRDYLKLVIFMKFISIRSRTLKSAIAMLLAAAFLCSPAPASAVVLDLSTMSCKQFLDSGKDDINMILTWLDGWYKGDQDEAVIDTDIFLDNAKKFGKYCAEHPSISIVNAAEKVLGD
jgi:acid stress chaperone HdeB